MSHYFIDKQDPRVADLLLRLENTRQGTEENGTELSTLVQRRTFHE